ncbi:Pimeloyl-ACP methyl ester carboxylesterase [Geodermatophilus obscurus]|uniref:Pimeloyl-ACP methyl ester carboxylesterase n=1 Tax=Geodermatophilus obscurus TaxID=1861 RepID=A0A1M7SG31_9ACTN|nr:alpha/beta hydrolase [Geodermatophilus obscurus]SHN57302.1 Pimeloyl-ACP methyl ester carboxylesterase [Geodermatophilus obscurus]
MERASINGVELEYEVTGAGEAVLLISPVLADGFLPLVEEPALADRYQLIRYHKRGWAGSTRTPPPVSVADHAADAAGLLGHLGVPRAHVAGHSTGAVVATQLAVDDPGIVQTLVLLEPFVLSVPSGEAVLQQAGPAFEAYGNGDHEEAWALFLSVACGLDRAPCRALLEQRIPGVVAQAVEDADTCFGVELPAMAEWAFGPEQAAAIRCPTLSVLGGDTLPLFVEVAALLRSAVPDLEERTIEGVGHLLHVQRPEPVARAMRSFLGRHPMAGD